MKFAAAAFVILAIAAVLTLGIILTAHGSPLGWVTIIGGAVVFLGLFVQFGCRGH